MTASPAKIKAYLSTIKERYLDDASVSLLSPTELFTGILKVELLLRGVVLQDDDKNKLWNQILSSVGKNLVTDLPKPLMAATNVMAGRVTESFCHRSKENQTLPDYPITILSQTDVAGSLQRAEDIQDERWLILLQSKYHNYRDMLQVALGYYTTAALIQMENPPMWKKVWDTWIAVRDSQEVSNSIPDLPPFEAQVAIEHLSRIAQSKGNLKRYYDLQLRLAQSCMNTNRLNLATISFTNKQVTTSTTLLQYFGDSVTSDLETTRPENVALKMSQKAIDVLDACRSYFEEQTNNKSVTVTLQILLYQALEVQAHMMQENAKIKLDAVEMHQRNLNRAQGITSMAECIQHCREVYVLSSTTDASIPFQKCSFLAPTKRLRNTVVSVWETSTLAEKHEIENDSAIIISFDCLRQSIECLYDYAAILSRKSRSYYEPWGVVLEIVRPLVEEMKRQSYAIKDSVEPIHDWLALQEGDGDPHLSSSKLLLVSTTLTMLPEIFWMMLGDERTPPDILDATMLFVKESLSALIHGQEYIDEERQKRVDNMSSVGVKRPSESTLVMGKWKKSMWMSICFVSQGDRTLVQQVTREAIQNSKRKVPEHSLSLLLCLVSWAGWYQRPWPFCSNLSETRRILKSARSGRGRSLTKAEEALLGMAGADAELLNGGFTDKAFKEYEQILGILNTIGDSFPVAVLQAHCLNGMARIKQIQLREEKASTDPHSGFGEEALARLQSMELPPSNALYIWHSNAIFRMSKSYQINVARQVTADSLMGQGNVTEAKLFLEAAVADSPIDSEAALAYGALLLRIALFVNQDRNSEDDKAAQIQLLRAAKLDASKADPFALLGIWFEDQGDTQRALGCFRKSLGLDPGNPVAGRGLLRQLGREHLSDILEDAVDTSMPSNGWAWHAVGLNKAYIEGMDDLAVVAILKGLRCRDIEQPGSGKLTIFFQGPSNELQQNEKAVALADVATCYRRLGRYTAAIRAFHASISLTGAHTPSTVLMQCAQIESELGFFEDAAEKFCVVLDRKDDAMALYGHAASLFSMAMKDFVGGKFGATYEKLQIAANSCLKTNLHYGCQLKLLGDIYSFCASLPPSVFLEAESTDVHSDLLQTQIKVVAKGEESYRRCIEIHRNVTVPDEQDNVSKSYILCDIAANILLQAQLLSAIRDDSDDENGRLFERASTAFRDALQENPSHAASWCGLGCSVIREDPLLAQHAFCRCLQLDKMFSDAYANAGFLYTRKYALDASRSTMEALTQVADTPMMWMNCALILEQEAANLLFTGQSSTADRLVSQAGDAFRASLQVTREPSALLGLSLTARVIQSSGASQDKAVGINAMHLSKRKDSLSLIKEYIGASTLVTCLAKIFHGVMAMEQADQASLNATWRSQVFEKGLALVESAKHGQTSEQSAAAVEYIVGCVKSGTTAEEKGSYLIGASPKDLQKWIRMEPDRADLWLRLAKELVKNDKLELASDASSRATSMLIQQLHHHRVSSLVEASVISEAVSMDAWLKTVRRKEDEAVRSCGFDLQRALLMDPENSFARQGLVTFRSG